MRKKIVNLEPKLFSNKAKKILVKNFDYIECNDNLIDVKKQIKSADIIISRFKYKLDKKLLSDSKKLKYIVSATTGLDHIDLNYIRIKNIEVFSLKNQLKFLKKIKSSSEHTWALLLALLKQIPQSFEAVKKYNWDRYSFLNTNLFKKKIGIIGLGRNGKNIYRYAKSFEMEVLTFDKKDKKEKLKKIFKISDIVILTIELNNNTKNIINTDLLNLVKKKFYLINTSRAEIINQKHLIAKIKKNKNFYFATDFLQFNKKLLVPSSKKIIELTKSNQILITPHIAGASLESLNLCEEYLAAKLVKYAK
jgi:D-3-phosphoglycerate dehydrogenase